VGGRRPANRFLSDKGARCSSGVGGGNPGARLFAYKYFFPRFSPESLRLIFRSPARKLWRGARSKKNSSAGLGEGRQRLPIDNLSFAVDDNAKVYLERQLGVTAGQQTYVQRAEYLVLGTCVSFKPQTGRGIPAFSREPGGTNRRLRSPYRRESRAGASL